MKSAVGFLKATIVGGALYLIPVSLILILLAKVHAIATDIVSPIAAGLELRDVGGINAARLLAVLAILLLCFIAGLFARTSVARRSIGWLERTILSNLPGYSAVAAIGQQTFTGTGTTRQLRTVLARIEDAWQFALLVEQIDEDHAAVFVPGAPDPKAGSVYFLIKDRVKPVDVSIRDAMKCLKGMGLGSRELFAGRL